MEINDQIVDLDTRITAIEVEMAEPKAILKNLNDTRSKLISEKKQLEEQKAKLKKKVTVADHAVIRYLERRYGFDFEDIRKEILTDNVIRAVKMGAEGVKLQHGTFKVKDNVIVTYVPN